MGRSVHPSSSPLWGGALPKFEYEYPVRKFCKLSVSKKNSSAYQKKSPAALKRSIISVKMFRLRRLNFTLEYIFSRLRAKLSHLKIFRLQHPRLDRFDLRVLHPRVPKTHSGLLPTVGWSSGEELLHPWESQWGGVLVVLLPTPPHSGVELTTIN